MKILDIYGKLYRKAIVEKLYRKAMEVFSSVTVLFVCRYVYNTYYMERKMFYNFLIM